jgi:hypothetical protein
VDAPVQVRFDDGQTAEGASRMFFPLAKLLPCSSITAWRYVRGAAQRTVKNGLNVPTLILTLLQGQPAPLQQRSHIPNAGAAITFRSNR